VIGKVGQRIAEGGQFPVEYSNDLGLLGVKDHVVDAEVTMNDAAVMPCGHTSL
jgi:hypothetical protein